MIGIRLKYTGRDHTPCCRPLKRWYCAPAWRVTSNEAFLRPHSLLSVPRSGAACRA